MKFGFFGKAMLLVGVLSFGGVQAEVVYGPDVYTTGAERFDVHITEQAVFREVRRLYRIKQKLNENPSLVTQAKSHTDKIAALFAELQSLYIKSKWQNPDQQKLKDFWHDQWDTGTIRPSHTIAAVQKARIVEEIEQCSRDQQFLEQNDMIDGDQKKRLRRAQQKTCGRDVYQLFRDYEKLVLAEAAQK